MKTWFITGASKGFGKVLTEKLLEQGNQVIATSRDLSTLKDLKEKYAKSLLLVNLDVSEQDQINHAVAAGVKQFGKLDVVASNAGYGLFGPAEELSEAQIENQINTNLLGSIRVIRAVIPQLRSQGGGRIIQFSSEGGQIAYPNFSLYHATKWGIEGFVEAVAQEISVFNIQCILVQPGPTKTEFAQNLDLGIESGVYTDTPAGELRRKILSGEFPIKGDVYKMCDAIIDCSKSSNPPKRLTLGASAYASVASALKERLSALEAQRSLAEAMDI